MKFLFPILLLSVVFRVGMAQANEPDFSFFESKIRPVLVENCYECHSVEKGKSKGDLLLDSRDGIRKGGGNGPAIVPGDPGKSLLIAAIRHLDPDLEMPPRKAKLPEAVAVDFETWIKNGAPDPREANGPGSAAPVSIEEGKKFWAFRKPIAPGIPETINGSWAKRDLDQFVLSRLEAANIEPSPDADPAILLRRLHFDLIGLPPSPEALGDFQKRINADGFESAWEDEVDSLLQSDRYGERWARHWLDVVRFAESSGKESNLTFPHAWRFRDYAIDAFNSELPFDQFLIEQIAGDLLPFSSNEERARLLIATGFLAFGTKGLNEMNDEQFAADLVDEQIDTTTRAILGQSVACARCHDHKYDAFQMRDYYALAGIFRSTETFFGTWIDSENNVGGDLIALPGLPGQIIPNRPMPKAKVEEMKAQVADLNRREKEGPRDLRDALGIIWRRGGLEGKLATVDDEGRALPLAMGTLDRSEPCDAPLLERGEISKPGEKIKRAFPAVFSDVPAEAPSAGQSGRLELARWITHPDHPLTARVMANRIWKYLIGEGIVRTVDNFGFTGQRPDNPELLDYLALHFRDSGWSVKSVIREIVLSRTYRQASDWREPAFQKDPENRLVWRIEKKRLEAECIRDAMLSLSGELDISRRPGSLVAEVNGQSVALFGFNKKIPRDLDGSLRRSVYLPVVRDRLPDVFALFDFAEPSLVTGRRDMTNVPVQALYLLNSSFVLERSAAFASRIEQHSNDRSSQIQHAYQLCFARNPDSEEIEAAQHFLTKHPDYREGLAALCQALFSTAEFRNLD